jgi:hypothetical protein
MALEGPVHVIVAELVVIFVAVRFDGGAHPLTDEAVVKLA